MVVCRDSAVKIIQLATVLAVLVVAVAPEPAAAQICPNGPQTLSEQIAGAEDILLVKWLSGVPGKRSNGSTKFEVVEVGNQHAAGKLKQGSKVRLNSYRPGKPDELFLLPGTLGEHDKIEWIDPVKMTPAAFEYVKNLPKPDQAAIERLEHFLKYLEHSDEIVRNDAFSEFSDAAHPDLVQLAGKLPIDKLRTWFTSDAVSNQHWGLYGVLLGLCGTNEDAMMLERMILESTDKFRLGINGVMSGYLLLTGEKGLAVLDETKLKNRMVFMETYAAMQALQFMWNYGENRINSDRLRQSMRILLDCPEMTEWVVYELARMKDWSVQDQLMKIYESYDTPEYNEPSIKLAIARYLLSAVRDTEIKNADGEAGGVAANPKELPAHVDQAQKHLAELARRDPKTVEQAKRFFVPK